MSEYRYLACDLLTDTLIAELPLTKVKYGEFLNDSGGFEADLKLGQTAQTTTVGVHNSIDAFLISATEPGKTAIWVERDGALRWGGIIWGTDYDTSNRTVKLVGSSFVSFFKEQIVRNTVTWSGIDQLQIARDLITAAQAVGGANINVQLGSETSGRLRDHTIYSYETKYVFEALKNLSRYEDGFDFMIDVAYVGGVRTKTLNLGYPRRGRTAAASGHVFEMPGNIVSFSISKDAISRRNEIVGIGAGEGDKMLRTTIANTDMITAGYPLLTGFLSLKDVSIQATLEARTRAEVTARSQIAQKPKLIVKANMTPQIGDWISGDDIRVRLGFDVDKPEPYYPNGNETYYRIIGWDCTPGDNGEELVELLLN